MKMSGLLSRRGHDLPGVVGTVRLLAPGAEAPRRLGSRDVVVADLNRMSAATARAVVDAGVAAVVHLPRSGDRMMPRTAFRTLAASTVPVVEDVTTGADSLTEGTRVRIDEGVVYRGESELAEGREVGSEELLAQVDAAETEMVDSAQAHLGNATEFLRLEHSLLLDGEGVPEIDIDMEGRHVVVVSAGEESARRLSELKSFIREYRPVLIGVGAGADVLRASRHDADLIVADPEQVTDEALTDGAVLVVPADRDGHGPGLDRATTLGVTATTFPADATDRDMALLLAHHGGAAMIVVTDGATGLVDAYGGEVPPSTTIVERAVAGRLVHAEACASLYRSRGAGAGVALLVLAALVALAAIVVARGAAQEVLDWAVHTWNTFALWVQGLLR